MMASRPKRSSDDPTNYSPPSLSEIKAARQLANHSMSEAAEVVGMSLGGWRKYEARQSRKKPTSHSPMPFAVWTLYRILAIGDDPAKYQAILRAQTAGRARIGYRAGAGRPWPSRST